MWHSAMIGAISPGRGSPADYCSCPPGKANSVPSQRSGTRRDVAARDGRMLTHRVEFFVKKLLPRKASASRKVGPSLVKWPRPEKGLCSQGRCEEVHELFW